MSDTPADPPKPPRVLPRAARLSRLTPVDPVSEPVVQESVVPEPAAHVAPPAPAAVAPAVVVPPASAPAVAAPEVVVPAAVAPAVIVPAAVASEPVVPTAPVSPAPRAPSPLIPIGSTSTDVVDLAQSIANASPAVVEMASTEPPSASGPIGSRALETGHPLRSVPTTSYTPAPAQSTGPVTFKPLVDPWANRSVIVASFGLVLCFFPVLSLAGLLMGVFSLRRISASGGSLIGSRTARFGVILGGAGFAIGVAFGIWFLVTQ